MAIYEQTDQNASALTEMGEPSNEITSAFVIPSASSLKSAAVPSMMAWHPAKTTPTATRENHLIIFLTRTLGH